MVELPKELPDDAEQLKELIRLLAAERTDYFEKVQIIEQRYRELIKGKFGKKNETFDADQLLLFAQQSGESASEQAFVEAVAAPVNADAPAKKQGHGRRKPDEKWL